MPLPPPDITRIARLARLDMTPERLARAQDELNELQSVDTEGVAPLAHPLSAHEDIGLRLRDDVASDANGIDARAALLANAPATHDGLFLVPRVIE